MHQAQLDDAALSQEDVARFGTVPQATFRANLERVEERIARACQRAGRDRQDVRLLPVSKTVPAHILRYAYAAGIRQFGENRLQEAATKRQILNDLDADWSIIGHLQTNKVKHLTSVTQEFHALDSLRLADAINTRLEKEDAFLNVFIQVNTSGEASKYGLHPDALAEFVETLPRFQRLRPQGLMTLALFSSDMNEVRPCFKLLRRLGEDACKRNAALTLLSMGMSGDFELAIEEGADVIRVGQAIFGERSTPDGHYWPGVPDSEASSVPE